jgi:hypothetical protein
MTLFVNGSDHVSALFIKLTQIYLFINFSFPNMNMLFLYLITFYLLFNIL